MADCITQASNANAHPGIVNHLHSHQSKDKVTLAKQEKSPAKAQAKKQKADNIQRVAQLECEAKHKKKEMEQQANDPVNKITQPRAKWTRNQESVNRGTIVIMWDYSLTFHQWGSLAGPNDEGMPYAAKKLRTQENGSNNTSISASQNDGDVIAYWKPEKK